MQRFKKGAEGVTEPNRNSAKREKRGYLSKEVYKITSTNKNEKFKSTVKHLKERKKMGQTVQFRIINPRQYCTTGAPPSFFLCTMHINLSVASHSFLA